jgi:hypothetical protein
VNGAVVAEAQARFNSVYFLRPVSGSELVDREFSKGSVPAVLY